MGVLTKLHHFTLGGIVLGESARCFSPTWPRVKRHQEGVRRRRGTGVRDPGFTPLLPRLWVVEGHCGGGVDTGGVPCVEQISADYIRLYGDLGCGRLSW